MAHPASAPLATTANRAGRTQTSSSRPRLGAFPAGKAKALRVAYLRGVTAIDMAEVRGRDVMRPIRVTQASQHLLSVAGMCRGEW